MYCKKEQKHCRHKNLICNIWNKFGDWGGAVFGFMETGARKWCSSEGSGLGRRDVEGISGGQCLAARTTALGVRVPAAPGTVALVPASLL